LPFTYVARVPAIEGDDELFNDYFCDTICGLIEYLDSEHVEPDSVSLYGLYLSQELALDKSLCIASDGTWMNRPDVCRSLEQHYRTSMEEQYKGHIERGTCAYDDRERDGDGPY